MPDESIHPPPAIAVRDVSKIYRVYTNPLDRLKELLSPASAPRRYREVEALRDVSFEIAPGERLGILGQNGSGKSTLLRLIAGVLTPSAGSVAVHGRVTALLELGSSFNAELTGRENVYQYGALMGYAGEELERRFREIHAFSEIGDFIDHPMKTYSSGMNLRLAFAASTHVEPDVLIIDEALAVGDSYFQAKSAFKIKKLLELGCTFLYVSHSPDAVRSLCNRAILLQNGRVVLDGGTQEVTSAYAASIYKRQTEQAWYRRSSEESTGAATTGGAAPSRFTSSEAFARRVAHLREGTGEARITDVRLLDREERDVQQASFGETLTVRVSFQCPGLLPPQAAIGVGINDRTGLQVLQFMSDDEGVLLESTEPGERFVLDFTFENCLAPGEYSINVGITTQGVMPNMPMHRQTEQVLDATFGGLVFSALVYEKGHIFGKVRVPVAVRRVDKEAAP